MKNKLFILAVLFNICITPVASATSKSVTVNSHADIQEILEISVTGQGNTDLRFGNVQASQSSNPTVLMVNVASNSGSSYQLNHTLQGNLSNSNGDTIEVGNIQFTSTSSKGLGTTISSMTSMTAPSQTVYLSDSQGTNDTLTISYVLTPPENQAPGDYFGAITYTASSI